jgi:hypothetical protein
LNFSPLPGKIPTKVVLPLNIAQHATNNSQLFKDTSGDKKNDDDDDQVQEHNTAGKLLNDSISFPSPSSSHAWARMQPPFIYVQQVLMRSMVLPFSDDLNITDAFRAPLFEVFKLLEIINNHETNVTLSNLCLHVDSIKRPQKDVLFPEYNCLVLSPANFWKQNIHNFHKDNCLLGTIFQHHVRFYEILFIFINFILILFFRTTKNQNYQLLKCYLAFLCLIVASNGIHYKNDLE